MSRRAKMARSVLKRLPSLREKSDVTGLLPPPQAHSLLFRSNKICSHGPDTFLWKQV